MRAAGTGTQALTTGLFSITCTTCQAKLRVRNVEAIGQILACPRCQSMVQVLPPPGWSGQANQAANALAAAETTSPVVTQMGVPQPVQPAQVPHAAHPLQPLKESQNLSGSTTSRPNHTAHPPANVAGTCSPAAVQAASASKGAEAQSQWFDGSDAAFHSKLRSVWKTPLACERAQGIPCLKRPAELYMRLVAGIARLHLGLYVGAAALVVCIATGAWVLLPRRASDKVIHTSLAAVAASQQPRASATAGSSGRSNRSGAHASRKQSNRSRSLTPPKAAAALAAQARKGPDRLVQGEKPSPRRPPSAKHPASEPHGDPTFNKKATGTQSAEKHDDEDAAGENAGDAYGPGANALHHEGTSEDGAGNGPATRPPTSDVEIELVPGEPAAPEPQTADADVLDAQQIDARLQVPLAAIELPDIALGEAIDILGQLASVRIELDVEALGDAGRSPGDRVRVSLTQTTVAEALATVLAQYNLTYDVRQGVIWIRPR